MLLAWRGSGYKVFLRYRTRYSLPCKQVRTHSSYLENRSCYSDAIDALPEFRGYLRLQNFLDTKVQGGREYDWITAPIPPKEGYSHEMSAAQIVTTVDSALITFCLHVEARIAALIGVGFYTIGPCGEETLSPIGICLQPHDSLALHYRHSGINVSRQLIADLRKLF
jgi:hypothetical protein